MNLVTVIAAALVMACLLNVILSSSGMTFGGDDSDLWVGGKLVKRSGLGIVTDYKTGVQYLVMPLGGMTPRLDADGKPIVVKMEGSDGDQH